MSAESAHVLALHGTAPRIDPSAWVAPGAVVVGDVALGADSSVWYGAVLRGDINRIRIGDRTNLQDHSVFHVSADHPCEVGSEVTVGHRAVVHGCVVEDGALIGIGAVVLDGARVEQGAWVAAGALVPAGAVVPAGTLAVGMPARSKRSLEASEIAKQRERTLRYVDNARFHAKAEPA
ncbi:MAG: gamma carbonic anhydrase family protein [Myxococcota bacterium]